MLPGLRFLFGAIVLSMSVLVFGLGAAALLRAAHEEFASMPSRRPPPETIFAQPNNEAARPVLSMLRVDPPAEEPKASEKASDNQASDNPAPENMPAAAPPAEPEAIVTTPAEPDRIAALTPDDSSPPATEKPEITVPEASAPSDAAAAAEASAPPDEIKMAATPEVPPPASEAAPAASEQAAAPASPETGLASIKIATLGGPPVAIEAPTQTAGAKAEGSAIKKRARARRAKERRRLEERARLARQAAQQRPADLFPQPTITTRTR
jgi:cytoskeletal protein RodZ